jgi:hypothetical protein
MAALRQKISKFITFFREYFETIYQSRRKTFKFTALFVFTILFLLQVGIILINNSFYTNFSDDILQYYTIMVDFVASIKDGSLSLFNLNNYFGASFFSDIYYIPLDIFTYITFILSYIMPTEVAYSITELLKIFSGVMALAFYFHLKGNKNRTIFWMSIFYLVSGGFVSFMAFPVFLSIIFYLPLGLIVIHYFFHGKRWLVPLFAVAVVFYDFYLAYMILAFVSFAFLIEYFKREGFKFLNFLKDGIVFLFLLLLGVTMAAVILLPSITYILEETYRTHSSFNPWIINIGSFELKLFKPEIYLRYLAKLVVEQKPIGFYGFENDYGLEHVSLYITIIGFVYMCNIFFMKDRISRVYKYSILIALIFMIFPLFSYVFSGTLDKPYTRWINLLPMFEVIILAHVFDKYGFEKVKMKNMTIVITLLLGMIGYLMYFYITKLQIDTHYAGRDVLTADTVMMGVGAFYLIVLLIFGWLKKYTVIKWFVWIEVLVAIGYIYSGPFSISNKIDTFNTMRDMSDFLEDNLEQEDFYRVYVDLSRFDVEKTNFNRMTSFPTNTKIFHSWTDAETNGISNLLFNSNEYQSKSKMNYFGYYINHFLGYKYLVVNSEDEFVFDEQYFTLVAQEDIFTLYEINYSENFRVFDTYFNSHDSDLINANSLKELNSSLLRQKALLTAAIIDVDKGYDMSLYDLDYLEEPDNRNAISIDAYRLISSYETITMAGIQDTAERSFYVYNEEDLDINFIVGAVYIKANNIDIKLDAYSEVLMEFSDGTKQSCLVYQIGTDENESNIPFQIKCEFWKRPVKIFIEKTEELASAPLLKMRSERAIDMAAYLEYDLSQINLSSTEGIILFDMTLDDAFEKMFVVDELGNSFECLDGYYNYISKPDKLYIYKTSAMYNYYDLYNLRLRYLVEDSIDLNNLLIQDHIENKTLKIENSKIHISYENKIQTIRDQIIVVPVAFSDDWQFISEDNYDTISVSGGFLGIVIPKGTESVDISLRFMPKYLDLGFFITLGATAIYLSIFVLPVLIKKNKRG